MFVVEYERADNRWYVKFEDGEVIASYGDDTVSSLVLDYMGNGVELSKEKAVWLMFTEELASRLQRKEDSLAIRCVVKNLFNMPLSKFK